MDNIDKRLVELGIELPETKEPDVNFSSCTRNGNMLFLSGQGPFVNGKLKYKGKLGDTYGIDDGYDAARLTTLNLLSVIKRYLGTLDRVDQILKIIGFVNCTADFTDQPEVMHGASDVLKDIFGTEHSRSAIGVNSLPNNIPVEIEMIVSVKED